MQQSSIYTCVRVNKLTQRMESRTTNCFKKEIDNSNHKEYYYFNYNHKTQLWENPYCLRMDNIIEKAFKHAKNLFFMLETIVLLKNEDTALDIYKKKEFKYYQKDLSLQLKLENRLNNIIKEKEKIKNEYEESKRSLDKHFLKKLKEVC